MGGGGTRPTPPSLASVVHTLEAVAGSRGSVNAPAISRVMGGAPERNKNSKKYIGEMTFGGYRIWGRVFVNVVSLRYMFVHGFLPDSMLAVVLVPIIKDKTGRIDRIDNYRPIIALASVVSKVVERILLDRISHFLETCPNQFGFKRNLGTDTCIYILKEMVDTYKSLNGGMLCAS